MLKPLPAIALALLTVPALAAPQKLAKRAPGKTVVVSTGSEQGLRLGGTVMSRPFGAQLVDRLAVVGTFVVRDASLYLVRGETGGDCPARYVVVAVRPGQSPVATDPFGTCSAAARGQLVGGVLQITMPATAAGGPSVRFGYDGGTVKLLDAVSAAAVASAPAAPPGYAAPTATSCRTASSADAASQATAVAEFERSYPAEYRRKKSLEKVDLSPDELRDLVTGLACVSTWPGAERTVPEAATPLFASRRHGAAAFAMLDRVAHDPQSNANMRAAVRSFAAEMNYRAAQRERF